MTQNFIFGPLNRETEPVPLFGAESPMACWARVSLPGKNRTTTSSLASMEKRGTQNLRQHMLFVPQKSLVSELPKIAVTSQLGKRNPLLEE